jgi:predicted transcriptional regulator
MGQHKFAMSFYLDVEILRLLDALALRERRNRSSMAREVILREAERQGLKLEVRDEVAVMGKEAT